MICTGFSGTIFEVTPEKETVWDYIDPAKASAVGRRFAFGRGGPPAGVGGPGPFAGNSQSVQLFPGFLAFFLRLSPEQTKQLGEFEKEASRKLEAMLNDEQRKQLKEMQKNAGPFGPGGPAGPPEIGRIMSSSVQDKLKLTADLKKQLDGLQKDAESKVAEILKDEQKKQLKEMQDRMKAFAGGPRRVAFGPPGGRRGGPGGFGGMGGGSALFRAYRYGPTYPGLAGKDLSPGKTIEELESQQPEKKN